MDVAVTRQGAVGTMKLLMVVLAAVIIWEGSKAVNTELEARGMTAGRPFLKGVSDLLVGGEHPATSLEARLTSFWQHNHRVIALSAMLFAAVLLVVRYLLLGRILDYLYLESEMRERRIYTGFLITLLIALGQAGMIYATVVLSSGAQASLVPVAMLVLLALNFLWFGGTLISARREERSVLRGLWPLCASSLGLGVLLAILTWRIESSSRADEAMLGSEAVLLSAATAFVLFLADGYSQTKIYLGLRQTQAQGATAEMPGAVRRGALAVGLLA